MNAHRKTYSVHPPSPCVTLAKGSRRGYILIARGFKNKWFNKFAEKEAITDENLWEAVKEIEAGLVEAD